METWHINKSVSIGHIITTCVVIVSLIAYVSNVEHSVEVNSIKIKINKELIVSSHARIDKGLETITNILLKQNNKQ